MFVGKFTDICADSLFFFSCARHYILLVTVDSISFHIPSVSLWTVIPCVTSRCNSIDVSKVGLYKGETLWPVASYQNRNNYCVSQKDEQVRSIPSRAGLRPANDPGTSNTLHLLL